MERVELETPITGSQWTQALETASRHPDSTPAPSPTFTYCLGAAFVIAAFVGWLRGFNRRGHKLRFHRGSTASFLNPRK
ncbi:hypothetical protein K2X33_09445 [bacterium]|nr:hypothetical protein [bacterium]